MEVPPPPSPGTARSYSIYILELYGIIAEGNDRFDILAGE